MRNIFSVKDTLTEEEFEKGIRSFIKDGLATEVMSSLTGGVLLVSFALKLGASNVFIGLLAAIPPMVQLIQIPSIYLIEKYRIRRPICVYASTFSRAFWLLIALIPFLFSGSTGLIVLIIAILLNTALGAVGGASWNSWMHDLLPHGRLGVLFSRRMSLSIGLGIPFSLAAGLYIDRWGKLYPQYSLYGYSLLFFLGFLVGILGVRFTSTIPEPRMRPLEEKVNFLQLILKPLKDVNFKRLIIFMSSWNFAINLAAPFFAVYMLKVLGLDITYVIGLTVLSQLANISFLRIWGRLADRFSNKSVLSVSSPLFLMSIFAWIFTSISEGYVLIILLVGIHIFTGISTAGMNLASGNIGLKLAPKGFGTVYLAANSLINSLAAGTAPVLGGRLADFFTTGIGYTFFVILQWVSPSTGKLELIPFEIKGWGFLFLIAVFVGLYSIHRLSLVNEAGAVEEKITMRQIIAEMGRGVRGISTADGLLPMVLFPYSIIRSEMQKVEDRV